MSRTWVGIALLALVAGCGAENAKDEGADARGEIRAAAQRYSDAFLTGDSEGAYAALSKRCQQRNPEADFAAVVASAKDQYGSALKFKSFSADINGDQAKVTYTYDVSAINQTGEPWVKEDGTWREDDC